MKETVSRQLGRCLTEVKVKDFDKEAERFAEFVRVSQFSNRPKHVSEIGGALLDKPVIHTSTVLYGVEQDGHLTWLGEIVDSSD